MPNLVAALKEEIRRLARREIKLATFKTKRAITHYRVEIGRLKRQVELQDKKIATLARQKQAIESRPAANGEVEKKVRFSPRSVKAQRSRLGLSALDYGKLVGVSGLTIYHWEQGKARPRKAQLAALKSLQGIGKRDAMARLEEIKGQKKTRAGQRKLARKKPR